MRYCLLAIFVCLLSLSLHSVAQSSEPIRVELPVRMGAAPFNTLSCNDEGILLIYPTQEPCAKDSLVWVLFQYDRNLKEAGQKKIILSDNASFIKGIYIDRTAYILFHDTKADKEKNNLSILSYRLDKKTLIERQSALPQKVQVADFKIYKNAALVGYNVRKGDAGVIGVSLQTGEKVNLDLAARNDATILDIAVDTVHPQIFVTYKTQKTANKNSLFINEYSPVFSLQRAIQLGYEDERRIVNEAQFVPHGFSQGILVGTYGYASSNRREDSYYDNYNYYNPYYYNSWYNRQQQIIQDPDLRPVTDGFFTAVIGTANQSPVKYSSLISLNTALRAVSQLGSRKVVSKRGKTERDTLTAKDEGSKNSLNYRVLMHSPQMQDDTVFLFSELYSAQYHMATTMNYDYYGRAYPTSYPVFDGYKYDGGFLLGFDKKGDLLWDNGAEIRGITTSFINQKMNFVQEDDVVSIFANVNGKISMKVVSNDDVLEKTSYLNLAAKRGTDQVVNEYLGSIVPWYGKYFLAYGYQTIRNNHLDQDKRTVFYMNKLALE